MYVSGIRDHDEFTLNHAMGKVTTWLMKGLPANEDNAQGATTIHNPINSSNNVEVQIPLLPLSSQTNETNKTNGDIVHDLEELPGYSPGLGQRNSISRLRRRLSEISEMPEPDQLSHLVKLSGIGALSVLEQITEPEAEADVFISIDLQPCCSDPMLEDVLEGVQINQIE